MANEDVVKVLQELNVQTKVTTIDVPHKDSWPDQLLVSPDGRWLTSYSRGRGELKIWDLDTTNEP